MNTALIWKKSIWDNNFRCTRCGELLFDKLRNTALDIRTKNPEKPSGELYCGKCGQHVGRFADGAGNKLHDEWSEQLRAEALEGDKREADGLRTENRELKNEIGQLRAKVNELEGTVYAKNSAIKEKNEQIRKAQERISIAGRLVEQLEGKIEELEKQMLLMGMLD